MFEEENFQMCEIFHAGSDPFDACQLSDVGPARVS
jgi:hypothetical protein